MTVTAWGTIPFPPGTNAAPLLQMGQSFAQLSTGLTTGATGMAQTTALAQQGWIGQAATAFAAHMTGRARAVDAVAQALAGVQGVMSSFAGALQGAETAYSAAATAEQAARGGLPWTAGALAAAIAAEAAAVAELEAAGAACAGALTAIVARVGMAELAPLGMLVGEMVGGETGMIVGAASAAAGTFENMLMAPATTPAAPPTNQSTVDTGTWDQPAASAPAPSGTGAATASASANAGQLPLPPTPPAEPGSGTVLATNPSTTATQIGPGTVVINSNSPGSTPALGPASSSALAGTVAGLVKYSPVVSESLSGPLPTIAGVLAGATLTGAVNTQVHGLTIAPGGEGDPAIANVPDSVPAPSSGSTH